MAFIVKKNINGKYYFYLNENNRVGTKVKTKTLAYLGKDREEAEKKMREFLEKRTIKENLNENTETKNESQNLKTKAEEINKIALSKGFFFPTAGIYGSSSGFYTYGHLGKLLKNNWENLWRKNILSLESNFHEIQSNNILPEKVFIASGHVDKFNDPMIECRNCHSRFRADNLLEENGIENPETLGLDEMTKTIKEKKIKCPQCGKINFSDVKQFNMMFSLNVGFNQKEYLSPETAQGVYIHFLEEFRATREKLPLGLASIDKAYRNEISPRQMFFRLREFTQAELQIFFNPEKINEHEKWEEVEKYKLIVKNSKEEKVREVKCEELNSKNKIPKFYLFYAAKVQEFYLDVLKVPKEKFLLRELSENEKAFYNKIHFDVEVYFDTLKGFKEVGGIHYRGNHDLSGHQKTSGKNMEVFYDGKKILPHVLELSFGVDRNIWALMDLFYSVGKEGSMLELPATLSPIKASVIPIVKKKEFEDIARDVFSDLSKDLVISYDESGSIGRRYARNDEIGTPYCITIDGDSLKNKDVTIRDRDTTKQIRVKISKLSGTLKKLIEGEIEFSKAGKLLK
ncbi:glycine--tRNA ligase [Candidatus Pacearchaeota archaeon]|nr:glycine--tRNA ligase [Candidatus Pacearchaeota archaeon]